MIDPGVALAALGITLLELSEAAAVGVAVYAELRNVLASFGAMVAGEALVLVPTFVAGKVIEDVPVTYSACSRLPSCCTSASGWPGARGGPC
ncbi:hypothetical protein [Acidilobus sp.]|uniref:hypothetical protein n=1 Tax=Acidilobus sp. TaxID=1872109 RepID=UPI003CFF0F70